MSHVTDISSLVYTERSWAHLCKLSDNLMDYLWQRVAAGENEHKIHKQNLAGNISKSLVLTDPEDRITKDVFGRIFNNCSTEQYVKLLMTKGVNLNNYKTSLSGFWVNYQNKNEFNPLHSHGGTFSFVIWMKIPYSWEIEKEQPLVKESNTHNAVGNFMFVYNNGDSVGASHITMSPEMNGYMAIFPSYLQHLVYPFYTSDDVRISISGNIDFS